MRKETLVEKLLANGKMTSCETKFTIVFRFNLFQVCPSVSFFVFVVFFVVVFFFFDVINGDFMFRSIWW